MLPFKRPPTLLPHCTQCFHRTISTSATATRKRRRIRHALKTVDQDLQERASILRTRIQEARVARREDWILGPLAPKRDTGDGEYGAVTVRDLKGAKWGLGRGVLSERHRGGVSAMGKKKKKKQGEIGTGMSWKESLIYVGDRVGIVSDSGPEGRDLGKIGVVAEVRRGRREVVVEGLNMADVKSILPDQPNKPINRSVPLPIPLSSVRLVHKVPDPATKIKADTVIERLIPLPEEKKAEIRAEFQAGDISQEEMIDRLRSRTIPGCMAKLGHWLEIPLPKAALQRHSGAPEYPDDTVRFYVEERSWTPTLLRAPMPGGVIDELRNKYSRFRTRHDAGYQLALENRARRKAEYQEWVERGGGMLVLPGKEGRRVEREGLKGRGEPRLERELLVGIGEVMARKGIEMTGKRRREVARNLSREGVVRWGVGVVGEGKGKGKGKGEVEGKEEDEDEDEDDGEEWEEEDEEEEGEMGKEDKERGAILEDSNNPSSEKRPTL